MHDSDQQKETRGHAVLMKISEAIVRHRILIIVLLTIIAGFSAYYYRKVPRDPSVEAMVLEDDPDLQAYNRFKEIFGNDEFVLLVTQVDDIFKKKVIEDIRSLTEKVEALPAIKEAISYTNIRSIRGSEDSILVEELVNEVPQTDAEERALRARALAESDFIGNIYDPDGSTLAIVARMEHLSDEKDSTETRTELTVTLRDMARQPPYDAYDWYVAGVPVLKSDLAEYQKREGKKFEIMIFSLLAILLLVIFRTVSGMLVTLIAVQASIFMLYAGHYFSGIPLSMVSSILTPLMLIYGVSSSVHIQTHYALRATGNISGRKALIAAVAVTIVPCMFNSVTTSVGLGSNMLSAIKPIREFSMFASAGIMLSFFLSFLLIPAGLSFFKKPGKSAQRAHEGGWRVHALEYIVRITEKHKPLIGVVTLALLGLSLWGMSLINVDTRLLEYFKKDSDIRMSYDFINENLSGISGMEIMIDTGEKNGMKQPENIAAIGKLADYLRAQESLTSVTSLENFYRRINMALHADDPQWRKLPESRQEAAQLIMLYAMSGPESDLYNYTSRDYRYGRISARIANLGATELQELVGEIKSHTDEAFAPLADKGVKVHVTGAAVLYANMNSNLVDGQLKSFGLSLLLISIMMILVAGDIGLGLVSLAPNLMPIAVTMGLMGFLGYPLDSTSAMVAPIALGMAVDSTIHFMVRFRREYLSGGDYDLAAARTVRLIGRAMIGTSIPLAAGFFVLTSSVFQPVFVFGLLSGIVVLLAMVFDLVLTPICMVLYKPKYKRNGLVDFFD